MSDQGTLEITDEWIAEIYDEIVETIKTGSPAQKKALVKRLIVQVEIDGKVAYPKYRVPTANPPGVFDGEPAPLSDVAATRIAESVAALRRFVAEHGSLPTAQS